MIKNGLVDPKKMEDFFIIRRVIKLYILLTLYVIVLWNSKITTDKFTTYEPVDVCVFLYIYFFLKFQIIHDIETIIIIVV